MSTPDAHLPRNRTPASQASPQTIRTKYLPLAAFLTLRGHRMELVQEPGAKKGTFVFAPDAARDTEMFQAKQGLVEPIAFYRAIEDIWALLRHARSQDGGAS